MRVPKLGGVYLLILLWGPIVEVAGEENEPLRHALIVSIDGLMPAYYLEADELGLKIPNLRRLMAEGAFARGVQGVLPTTTYPSHTTLITGVTPRVHGVISNRVFDPTNSSNRAWNWFASAVRVPSLVTRAKAEGLTVGAVSWPVSVGLEADFNLPEFWRPGSNHEVDLELIRALSTPGLVAAVEKGRGVPFPWPLTEAERVDTAIHILRNHQPRLLLVHIFELDHQQHEGGPRSPEALKALEESDFALGRLLKEVEAAGLADSTLIAVVSDHGFLEVNQEIRPNTLLLEAGLLKLDDQGEIESWQAVFHQDGGSSALFLAESSGGETLAQVQALLTRKQKEAGSGLLEILGAERIAELGGGAEAALVLDAAPGFKFSDKVQGNWLEATSSKGHHGFAPDRPAMAASLLVVSPGLALRGDLGLISMTSIAPTLALWLGLDWPEDAGEALPLWSTEGQGSEEQPQ